MIGPEQRHPRARRRHERAGDGVDHGHLLDEQGLLGARRRHRQAARDRRLARPRRGDRARRAVRACARRCDGAGSTLEGATRRRAGLRQRRQHASRGCCRAPGAKVVAVSRLERRRRQRRAGSTSTRACRTHKRAADRSPSFDRRRADHERRAAASCQCDVLVPAALEQVITDENARARPGAASSLEGANGPTTPDGRRDPRASAASWSSRTSSPTPAASSSRTSSGCRTSRSYFWKEDEVNERLTEIVDARVRRDVDAARGASTSRCGWPPTASASSASPRRP